MQTEQQKKPTSLSIVTVKEKGLINRDWEHRSRSTRIKVRTNKSVSVCGEICLGMVEHTLEQKQGVLGICVGIKLHALSSILMFGSPAACMIMNQSGKGQGFN